MFFYYSRSVGKQPSGGESMDIHVSDHVSLDIEGGNKSLVNVSFFTIAEQRKP